MRVTWRRSSVSHGSRVVNNSSKVAVADGGVTGIRRIADGMPFKHHTPFVPSSTSAGLARCGSRLYDCVPCEDDGQNRFAPFCQNTANCPCLNNKERLCAYAKD